MKEIILTKGKKAQVDDDDYEELDRFKWRLMEKRQAFYVVRDFHQKNLHRLIYMHREIMNCPGGLEVDHIDGNGLNNRKQNLRVCTRQQNAMNMKRHTDSTSAYKGVHRNKRDGNWCAQIMVNGKKKHLGYYNEIEVAARVYNRAAEKIHGDFANLNPI